MEIKLGIAEVAREISLETDESPEQLSERLNAALTDGRVFTLTDANGRTIFVPSARIGYLELGSPNARRVGFGAA